MQEIKKDSENEKKNNSNKIMLIYNERISRIILIIGTFSIVSFLYAKLWNLLDKVFNVVYINSNIPIGPEHIWVPVLLAELSLIFIFCIRYCYFELFNFSDNDVSVNNYYKIKADNSFKNILGILKFGGILTLGTILISLIVCAYGSEIIYFFDKRNTNIKHIILIIVIIVLLVILLTLFKLIKKKINIYCNNFLIEFKVNIIAIFGIWLSLAVVFFLFGIFEVGDSEKSNVYINFYNENGVYINFQFENRAPKEIIIQSNNGKANTISIKSNQLYMSYVEATKENYRDNTDVTPLNNQFMYKNSYYKYYDKINISKLVKEGKNSIIITFKLDEVVASKKSYRIVNQFDYINGKIEMFKDKFDISLD